MLDEYPYALQHDRELVAFINIIRDLGATSYLEVGAKFGGSFYRIANMLPKGSRVVAVDLPSGTKAWTASEKSLREVQTDLIQEGYRCDVIWGDSTDPAVIDQVKALGPFDVCLIDANHTLPYV